MQVSYERLDVACLRIGIDNNMIMVRECGVRFDDEAVLLGQLEYLVC
jgi:hypothetical protein